MMGGMETDALQFTLHSWRHLLPTAARQLRLSESEQFEIGHWRVGSAMPRKYDSAACVTEPTAKAAFLEAIASGWEIAEADCVAQVALAASPHLARLPVDLHESVPPLIRHPLWSSLKNFSSSAWDATSHTY